jgi:hypothetical protein
LEVEAPPARGWLSISDGASERLEAQTLPIDLDNLGIMVDPAADAEVEILVIGA